MKSSVVSIVCIYLSIGIISPFNLYAQSFSIGQSSQSISDPQRSRNIDTEIFYPATQPGSNTPLANGNFPLIVFGHGFSMNFGAYQNFVDEFVPKGFILVFPKTEVGPIPFPDHAAFGQDLSFLTDYFQAQSTDPNAFFYQKINGKTAVMGHSMGGGCSFLAAEQNSNINVMATFAAAETNVSAIAAAQNVNIPALVFAGSEDNVAPPLGNQIDMYNNLASDCKYLITLDGGSHCGFANSNAACDFGETSVCLFCSFISRAEQHLRTFSVLGPWLDFHLKTECNKWTDFELSLQNTTGLVVQTNCTYALPEANFQAQGDSTFCLGDSIVLNTTSTLKKKWSTNDTSFSIKTKNSGQYYLIVEDQYACKDTSRTISVTVNHPADIVFNYPDTVFCGIDSIELQLLGNYNTVSWSGLGVNRLWVSESGIYTVEITDSNNCVNKDSIDIILSKADTNFLPQLSAKPSNFTCPEESIILSMSDTLDGSVFWSNGSNQQDISTDSAGIFFVQRTDSFGCVYYSDSIEVGFYDLPNPLIDTIADSVFLVNPANYGNINWYYNDSIQLNQFQNETAILPDTSGLYQAEVIDSNGCTAFSLAVYFKYSATADSLGDTTNVRVEELDEFSIRSKIKIHPNPVQDLLYIDVKLAYDFRLVDISGRVYKQGELKAMSNIIDLQELPQGIYFLQLLSDKKMQSFKMLKIL
ncbi:MAG: T9SS type A sorting domain-containing protein [Chitinophagales bacterium]